MTEPAHKTPTAEEILREINAASFMDGSIYDAIIAAKRYVAGLPSTGGIQAHGFRRCPVDDRACDCMQPCSVTSTEPAPRLSAEQLAAWFFHDCNVAVYAYGELAEEMLRYFDVRPLDGVAVHLPSVTSTEPAPRVLIDQEITDCFRRFVRVARKAYDTESGMMSIWHDDITALEAVALTLSSTRPPGPLVPWELDCQQHPTQCTAPECDCPAVSSTSDSPLMHAAEKAARAVDGWSDSKRQYAERATGISSPNAVTIAAMEDAGEITDTRPERGEEQP